MIKSFVKYFNSFYGSKGIYPIRDTNKKDIKHHIEVLKQRFPKYKFEGDSVDREFLRDLIFTQEELQKAYNKQSYETA